MPAPLKTISSPAPSSLRLTRATPHGRAGSHQDRPGLQDAAICGNQRSTGTRTARQKPAYMDPLLSYEREGGDSCPAEWCGWVRFHGSSLSYPFGAVASTRRLAESNFFTQHAWLIAKSGAIAPPTGSVYGAAYLVRVTRGSARR